MGENGIPLVVVDLLSSVGSGSSVHGRRSFTGNDALFDCDVADPERGSLAVLTTIDGVEALASGSGTGSIDPFDRVLVAAEELVLWAVDFLAGVTDESTSTGLTGRAEWGGNR